mmetsp:Transcript_37279/g.71464  ORF Transcript_37279/g.71464 Transcript_37279/m.71464 type:complete len:230 (+) Transcript_37279:252-941(+)
MLSPWCFETWTSAPRCSTSWIWSTAWLWTASSRRSTCGATTRTPSGGTWSTPRPGTAWSRYVTWQPTANRRWNGCTTAPPRVPTSASTCGGARRRRRLGRRSTRSWYERAETCAAWGNKSQFARSTLPTPACSARFRIPAPNASALTASSQAIAAFTSSLTTSSTAGCGARRLARSCPSTRTRASSRQPARCSSSRARARWRRSSSTFAARAASRPLQTYPTPRTTCFR